MPETRDNSELPLVFTGSTEYLETCSLVLSAMGIHHTLQPDHSRLIVPPRYADAARDQLDRYFRENSAWPEREDDIVLPARGDNPPTLLMMGGLAVFFLVTGPWQDHSFWFRQGAIDSRAILEDGEWWRLVTALTLHADQVHLLGNCIIGGFFVHMLSRTLGSGLAWLSLIVCGALGNLINIAVREQVHHSVGFSTSIFAAIGLFSGLQLLAGRKARLKELMIPIGAGAGLLAMLGSEGERTDLGAHFFGFLCGIAAGLVLYRFVRSEERREKLQYKLFLLTMFILIGSWTLAWHEIR